LILPAPLRAPFSPSRGDHLTRLTSRQPAWPPPEVGMLNCALAESGRSHRLHERMPAAELPSRPARACRSIFPALSERRINQGERRRPLGLAARHLAAFDSTRIGVDVRNGARTPDDSPDPRSPMRRTRRPSRSASRRPSSRAARRLAARSAWHMTSAVSSSESVEQIHSTGTNVVGQVSRRGGARARAVPVSFNASGGLP